jgi:U3 small nucleolar RNA-associated protein MPP10
VGSTHRSGASAPSKVRFHDEVKFKTIKAREGKGHARSIMQLLGDVPDDDDESFEVESEEEEEEEEEDDDDDDDDDQWGDTQKHSANDNSDAELSSDDEGRQSDDDESPEGGFTLSNGHQTIQSLQDDLLADEDEPDDGTLYFYRISICLCLAIRFIRT